MPQILPTSTAKERNEKRDGKSNRRVEDAICRRACGYEVELKKTYKLKRVEYDPNTGKKVAEVESLEVGTDEIHVPADLRAGAYWLNNRDPLHWKDHPDEGTADDTDVCGVVEISAVGTPAMPPEEEA